MSRYSRFETVFTRSLNTRLITLGDNVIWWRANARGDLVKGHCAGLCCMLGQVCVCVRQMR